RPGEVNVIVLDQDAVRWPWLLPGYQIEAVTVGELPGALGIPMPHLEGLLGARRAAADPHQGRTAERREAIAHADPDGKRSSPEVARITGIPERTVRRLLASRTKANGHSSFREPSK